MVPEANRPSPFSGRFLFATSLLLALCSEVRPAPPAYLLDSADPDLPGINARAGP